MYTGACVHTSTWNRVCAAYAKSISIIQEWTFRAHPPRDCQGSKKSANRDFFTKEQRDLQLL